MPASPVSVNLVCEFVMVTPVNVGVMGTRIAVLVWAELLAVVRSVSAEVTKAVLTVMPPDDGVVRMVNPAPRIHPDACGRRGSRFGDRNRIVVYGAGRGRRGRALLGCAERR